MGLTSSSTHAGMRGVQLESTNVSRQNLTDCTTLIEEEGYDKIRIPFSFLKSILFDLFRKKKTIYLRNILLISFNISRYMVYNTFCFYRIANSSPV